MWEDPKGINRLCDDGLEWWTGRQATDRDKQATLEQVLTGGEPTKAQDRSKEEIRVGARSNLAEAASRSGGITRQHDAQSPTVRCYHKHRKP